MQSGCRQNAWDPGTPELTGDARKTQTSGDFVTPFGESAFDILRQRDGGGEEGRGRRLGVGSSPGWDEVFLHSFWVFWFLFR